MNTKILRSFEVGLFLLMLASVFVAFGVVAGLATLALSILLPMAIQAARFREFEAKLAEDFTSNLAEMIRVIAEAEAECNDPDCPVHGTKEDNVIPFTNPNTRH